MVGARDDEVDVRGRKSQDDGDRAVADASKSEARESARTAGVVQRLHCRLDGGWRLRGHNVIPIIGRAGTVATLEPQESYPTARSTALRG